MNTFVGNPGVSIPNTFQIPLRDVTQKKGRSTLLVGMVSIAMIRAGIVPSKIEALGIEFDEANQTALLSILSIVTLYFLVGFILYGVYDFVDNRARLYEEKIREHLERDKEPASKEPKLVPSGVQYYRQKHERHSLYRPLYVCRFVYDCLLPVLVGVWALHDLWVGIQSVIH